MIRGPHGSLLSKFRDILEGRDKEIEVLIARIAELEAGLAKAKNATFIWQNVSIDLKEKLTIAVSALERIAHEVDVSEATEIAREALAKINIPNQNTEYGGKVADNE